MLLRANRQGWLALLLAGGLLAASSARAQVTVPQQSKIIDENLRKAWTDAKITHAKPANDFEFMRRVFLDVIGRIPTPEEVRDFERDKSTNKRAKLVKRLLSSDPYPLKDVAGKPMKGDDGKPMVFDYAEEYAEHWADIWTVWLMTRAGTHEVYHEQMKFWLKSKVFSQNLPHDQMVKELLTAKGKGSDVGAANFVMAHLGDPSPQDRRISDGPFDSIPITSRVTRLFLGVQTQCTQCHDHPFNPEWGQENFWGVNAFFRTTTRDLTPAPPAGTGKKKGAPALPVTVSDDPKLNDSMRIYYERRTGVLMSIKPSFLPNLADLEKDKADRAKKLMPTDGNLSRREVLAKYVLEHDNFSKAFVNRMWGHFFGRGLNEAPTIDDFGGHNKIIHPEMLETLGKEFAKYKYDPKAMIEWICNSEAYHLSYVAPSKDMAKPENDVFFARMPLKAMSPEVLFESLNTATRADMQVDKDTRKAAREAWMNKLVRNFGDDEGNEMTFNGTIVQGLLMMNGKELNDEIRRPDGMVAKAMKKYAGKDQLIIDEIFLTALGRRPGTTPIETEAVVDPKTKKILKAAGKPVTEAKFVMDQLNAHRNGVTKVDPKDPKAKNPAPTGGSVQAFYEDLFWTLLNTGEFMLNH